MTELPTIGLLGAEKQAAGSAALAWPERRFLLVTENTVVDGWDLPNVQFQHASPENLAELLRRPKTRWVPLCSRWASPKLEFPSNRLGTFYLNSVLPFLEQRFGQVVLPIAEQPWPQARCIVKGNHWHRPDATLISNDLAAQEITDPYGCGLVYQPHWPWKRLLLATGWRANRNSVLLGIFHIFSEICARDDVLGAGQTIEHPQVTELTLAMLESLDHRGFFTFNWLERGEQVRLSSFRPVPRALFRTFRRGSFDPFAESVLTGVQQLPANLKFVVDITYTSYQNLAS
jgi:hypothetical protein